MSSGETCTECTVSLCFAGLDLPASRAFLPLVLQECNAWCRVSVHELIQSGQAHMMACSMLKVRNADHSSQAMTYLQFWLNRTGYSVSGFTCINHDPLIIQLLLEIGQYSGGVCWHTNTHRMSHACTHTYVCVHVHSFKQQTTARTLFRWGGSQSSAFPLAPLASMELNSVWSHRKQGTLTDRYNHNYKCNAIDLYANIQSCVAVCAD